MPASPSHPSEPHRDIPQERPRLSTPAKQLTGPLSGLARPPAAGGGPRLTRQTAGRERPGNALEQAGDNIGRETARRALPSAAQLQRGRAALQPLQGVTLPHEPTTAATLIPRKRGDSAHGYTDVTVALRREIAEVQAGLAQAGAPAAKDYARTSMEQWARRTERVVSSHPDPAMAKQYLGQASKHLYKHWRSPELTRQTYAKPASNASGRSTGDLRTSNLVKAFHTLTELGNSAMVRKSGLSVTGAMTTDRPERVFQKYPKTAPRQGQQRKSARDFQYVGQRSEYLETGAPPSNLQGPAGRLTVNFTAASAPSYIGRIHEATSKHVDIKEFKLPNFGQIGRRVDDAVVYLGAKNAVKVKDAQLLADQIAHGLPMPDRPAAPPGMEPLNGAVSYAETRPGDSTSQFESRRPFVAAAVTAKLSGDKRPMSALMKDALKKSGYDPKQPSRVAQPGGVASMLKKLGVR
ncbi:hypothetical protein D0T25_24320 [Duganella sp. BJB488]|nr:hypothetical protein D0T25_24320 [Duganella sp. BJB488]